MSKILITGGTGGVGSYITQHLIHKGHEVVYLSRTAGTKSGIKAFRWDPENGYIDPQAFDGVNVVINLAGAGIADHRWTTAYKKELYDSRVGATRLLVNYINTNGIKLDVFISASGMGIYGLNTLTPALETDPAGNDFLAKLCYDWEQEAAKISDTRLVVFRFGIVLAEKAGFIPKVSRLIRYGIGSILGTGKQMMSWIHIADLSALLMKALTDLSMSGPYNAVSPDPQSNKSVTYAMAKKLHRPILLPPAPKIALQLMLGEITTSLLANQEVSSTKVEQSGFVFNYPSLENALDNLLPDTK